MSAIRIPGALRVVERLFASKGHDLVLVGGCVRDALLGLEPKDVDLATSATPDEQIALYDAAGVRYFATGLQHGTITALLDDVPYEITTYRTDAETDGRHAKVVYTRDLATDLERRDLTINAMAMTFTGDLVDPFGGAADLSERRIRFVGEPGARIQEDYLRILRYFRFLGRFSAVEALDPDLAAIAAIREHASGLRKISVERIWAEMSRIITNTNAIGVLRIMAETGVAGEIGLPHGGEDALRVALQANMGAATSLGAYLAGSFNKGAPARLARDWRLSNNERRDMAFVASRMLTGDYRLHAAKRDLVDGHARQNVVDTLRLSRRANDAEAIGKWELPLFPVKGADLLERGMTEGQALGARMKAMRERWIASDYSLDRDALLEAEIA